ncbi:MAG TPA: flagellar basal body P-ring formation chaperone FlgA [Lysobacter sp.]
MDMALWFAFAVLGATPVTTQRVDGEHVATLVQQALQSRAAAAGSTAKIQVSAPVADQSLPGGPLRIEVGEVAGRWPRARAGVPVRLEVVGYAPRSMTVWVSASDPRTVLTYAADYSAGVAGKALRVTPALVDMVCCVPAANEASALSERRLRRAVRVGAPVLDEDLEPLPAVAAQQPIAVAVERGAVRIVTTGVALQDGVVGERIAVRAEQSRHAVQARVVAKGEVIVDE